jgi:hypothetical protein
MQTNQLFANNLSTRNAILTAAPVITENVHKQITWLFRNIVFSILQKNTFIVVVVVVVVVIVVVWWWWW